MISSPPLVSAPAISLAPRLPPATPPTLAASLRRRSTAEVRISVRASVSLGTVAEAEEEVAEKIGARVRVTAPVKVYHVPKVPEIDLVGREGRIKQYVGVWKGKRISANLPFRVEFVADVEGRGGVKFVAHLKEDEFEYLD